jgi:hypothetical protein
MVLGPFESAFVPELDEAARGSQLIGKHEVPGPTKDDETPTFQEQYDLAACTYLLLDPVNYLTPEPCLTLIVAEPLPKE